MSIHPTSYWSTQKRKLKNEKIHIVLCLIIGSVLIALLVLSKIINHVKGNMNKKVRPEESDISGIKIPGANALTVKSLDF